MLNEVPTWCVTSWLLANGNQQNTYLSSSGTPETNFLVLLGCPRTLQTDVLCPALIKYLREVASSLVTAASGLPSSQLLKLLVSTCSSHAHCANHWNSRGSLLLAGYIGQFICFYLLFWICFTRLKPLVCTFEALLHFTFTLYYCWLSAFLPTLSGIRFHDSYHILLCNTTSSQLPLPPSVLGKSTG